MVLSCGRFVALVFVFALFAVPVKAGDDRGAVAQRPNILFLFSDDQRADTIAAYGNLHIRTPNLDRLSRRGFNFRRAYCMGSIHGAVCQPSRAMLNSGRTLYRVPMDLSDTPILPELLGQAGYTTFGTGKWHNGQKSFARGFSNGSAVFFGGMSDHDRVPLVDIGRDGKFVNKRTGDGFSSTMFADAVIDFLRSHDGDSPFYAYVSFTAPHDPRTPPPEYRDAYLRGRCAAANQFHAATSVPQRLDGRSRRTARCLAAHSGSDREPTGRVLRHDHTARCPGGPHSRSAGRVGTGRQHNRRLFGRSRIGHGQPWSLGQAEPVRTQHAGRR